jgi:predicted ribosomally synthesized peptide with SipW-like signal peptide
VHALLLLVGVLLLVLAVWLAMRMKLAAAGIGAVVGAAAIAWFSQTDVVPDDFTTMTPYVTTLLVLALASQRLRMPAADGLTYRRGQGG